MVATIYHLTTPALWAAAVADGHYEQSTRDASLADVGFIHGSFASQVLTVAGFVYADWHQPLVLLTIDPTLVTAPIKVENTSGGEEQFPHIYGPLNVSAVTAVVDFGRDGTGHYVLPDVGDGVAGR